jgi:competence protein ComEC
LAIPALLFAGGVAVSRLAGLAAAESLVCLAVAVAGALLARTRALARMAAWIAWCAAGSLVAALQPPPSAPPMDLTPRRLEGCVVESSVIRNDRMQFTLELRRGARVRVSWPPSRSGSFPPPLLYGERAAAELRLWPVRGFRNPGGFDIAAYQARRGIFWSGAPVRGQDLDRLPGACGAAWRRPIERMRAAALERIDAVHNGDETRAALMRGLLLGDKSGIRKAWIEDFRRTGTYHALVISGSHVTLVCGLFLFWRRISGLGWRWVPLAASLLAWLYALMAGADPPVMRAAAGFTLFGLGALFYRRLALLNTVAVVAIVFLALDPDQLFESSFQLSFLAVAALGAFFPGQPRKAALDAAQQSARLERRLAVETLQVLLRLPERLARGLVEGSAAAWRWARSLFLASAAVQLSLALPMALLFHRLSITGLSANVIAVPFVSLAIPSGFAAAITGWEWVGRLAGASLDISRRLAAWHARFEPEWRIPEPPVWLACCVALALFFWAAARPRLWRWLAAAVYFGLVCLVAWHPFPPRAARGELELTAIDVGQGESLLFGLPDGRFALVDTGGLPQHGRRRAEPFDVGEEVVAPYLWHRGIRRLDILVLTHLHEDHAAGAPSLIRNFRPRELWTCPAAATPLWREIEAAARQVKARIRFLKEGDACGLGPVKCRVLAPLLTQELGPRPHNNDSLVLEWRYGRHAFLLTGDIEARQEAELALAGLLAPVHVLKVPHHGSKRSATPWLLDAARPAVAVISAGADNPFGLPHAETLGRLSERRAMVLRTDRSGPVTVRSDGRYLSVERILKGRAGRFQDW